jgi:NAD(P)-dependent dehydrogenase (short-subunit alcohol dehydrogenase family)
VELPGKVVIVPMDWVGAAGLATRMTAAGATVVLVGPDGEAAGRLAATLEAGGSGRPAVFVTDGSTEGLDALAAFVAELFRPEQIGEPVDSSG